MVNISIIGDSVVISDEIIELAKTVPTKTISTKNVPTIPIPANFNERK